MFRDKYVTIAMQCRVWLCHRGDIKPTWDLKMEKIQSRQKLERALVRFLFKINFEEWIDSALEEVVKKDI